MRNINKEYNQIITNDISNNIFPIMKNWIHKECARAYRKTFTDYFYDNEILLKKITETYYLLVYSIYTPSNSKKKQRLR